MKISGGLLNDIDKNLICVVSGRSNIWILRLWLFINLFWGMRRFISQVIPHIHDMLKYFSVISTIFHFFIVILIISKKPKKSWYKILLIYITVFGVNFIYNSINRQNYTLSIFLNGAREYFNFVGALILWDLFKDRQKETEKFFLYYALFQLPLSVFQHVYFAMNISMYVVLDNGVMIDGAEFVGGGLGTSGTGVLTQFLYIFSFFFLIKRSYEGKIGVKVLILSFLILLPSILNETKIIFFLIPLYFLLFFRLSTTRILYFVFGVVVLFVFVRIYEIMYPTLGSPFDYFTPEYLKSYFITNAFQSVEQLSRWQKIVYLFKINGSSVTNWIFGHGIGMMKIGDYIGINDFGRDIYYITKGESTIFITFIYEGGIILIITILWLIYYFTNQNSSIQSKKIKKYFFIVLLLSLVYNNPFSIDFISSFFAYVIIGIYTIGANTVSEFSLQKKNI